MGVHYASGSYSWYSSCGMGKERAGERAQAWHGAVSPQSQASPAARLQGCVHGAPGSRQALGFAPDSDGHQCAEHWHPLCPPQCPAPPCHPDPSPAGAPRSSPPLAPAAAQPTAPQQPPGPPPPAGGEAGGQSHTHNPPMQHPPSLPLPDWGDMAETSNTPGMLRAPHGGPSGGVAGKGTPGTH